MLLSLLLASSALLFGVADSVAVMSVDLGAEWMKVAVVTVSFGIQCLGNVTR